MNIKPYIALFRVRMLNSIQYRLAAVSGIATQFAWGFMLIISFKAFYASNPENFPMTIGQTVTFMWIQQAFLAAFMLWRIDNSIFESIEKGNIAYDLVRPMDLYSRWFTTSTAIRVSDTSLRCIPILAIGFLLPTAFRIVMPGSLLQFLAFGISLVLALGVVVSFTMLVYISAFYTIDSQGLRTMVAILGDFLSGAVIPILFFPDRFRTIAMLLPFGSMQNMPILIFAGVLEGTQILQGIALQLFWVIALVTTGRLLMNRAVKRVITQGG